MRQFVNWAETASCTPAIFAEPRTEDELREVLRDAEARGLPVKVVGGGHSWSDAACTEGVLVSLDGLSRVIEIEGDRVTVEAGIRLDALNQTLADGSVRDLGASDDLFDAARVSLGALGIITRVTLQCEPAFRLEELAAPLPFDEAAAQIPQLVRDEAYVKLWWLPHTDVVQVFRYRRTEADSSFRALQRWVDDRIVNRLVFAALLRLGRAAPSWIPRLNALVRAAYFRTTRKVARSDQALTIAMPPVHQEVEYAIPLEHAPAALRRVRALIEREKL